MVKGTCVCANTGEDIVANLITPGGGSGETKTSGRTEPSTVGGRCKKRKSRRKKSHRKKRKTRRKTRRRKKKRRKTRRKRRVRKKYR